MPKRVNAEVDMVVGAEAREAPVLRFHVDGDLPQPVLIVAEHFGDAADGDRSSGRPVSGRLEELRWRRPPVPRQQFVELRDRRGGDVGENVRQPRLRVDVIQFCRDDHAIHHRGTLPATIGTRE